MKITPILIVDEIEPSLKFWVEQLGFTKTVEVPEGDKLGFVALEKQGCEVMMQSRASVRKDAGPAADAVLELGASLYIEVDNFGDAVKRLQGAEVLVPERTTFYGMRRDLRARAWTACAGVRGESRGIFPGRIKGRAVGRRL